MAIWASEIKELERLYETLKGQLPHLEKELERLVKADDENMILLYSRRCLEVIITDLCECELKRPRKTEPLKGIIDKLHKEEKVPSHIITSMHGLNELSTYGAHPKDFDPEQVKPVLVNLDIIIKWYLKYKDLHVEGKPQLVELKSETEQQTISPREKSIIVLPFENISPDPDQEYFSDGLTEEIITDLSHIHNLLVISRSSAMTFKGTKKKIGEIAREVNVRYVLEGSVRKAGNNLRITAQLIDGVNDSHVWAEKYTGTLGDVFQIQEKVSQSIAAELSIKLASEEEQIIALHPISNGLAYDAYLRARQEITRWTESALNRASQHLENAMEIVGNNASLYASLALLYLNYATGTFRPFEETLEKAKNYAKKALELDSGMALAYTVLGIIAYTGGDMRQAFALTKRSVTINPNDPDAVLWFVHAGISVGKCCDCRPIVDHVLQTDPLNCLSHVASAILEFYSGQFETAVQAGKVAYELDPHGIFSVGWYSIPLIWTGRFNESHVILDRWNEEMPNHVWWQFCFMLLNSLQANKAESLTLIQKIIGENLSYAWNDTVCIWAFAVVYTLGDHINEALRWLEHGLEIGCFNYPFLAELDPNLAKLHGNPRFQSLMERVKSEWENFEV